MKRNVQRRLTNRIAVELGASIAGSPDQGWAGAPAFSFTVT